MRINGAAACMAKYTQNLAEYEKCKNIVNSDLDSSDSFQDISTKYTPFSYTFKELSNDTKYPSL